jgi:deoxyhypusine synthase
MKREMRRRQKQIEHIKVHGDMTVDELVREFGRCGVFGAGRVAEAVDIFYEMVSRDDTTTYLGLAGALVPGGMRQVITDLIRDHLIDVLVTTGANMVHDMIEAFGASHYRGTAVVDDTMLYRLQIDRIYDVFLYEKDFSMYDERFIELLEELPSRRMSIREFLYEVGKRIDDPNSILRAAADEGVPVFCPAIADSAIGLDVWRFKQKHNPDLYVGAFADLNDFIDIVRRAKRNGAIMLGGGVPKNFILQAMIVVKRGGYDYAVQITMDRPEPGGLSGATLEEAKSWGKVRGKARSVQVIGDASIIFPLMVAAVRERLAKSKPR